MIVNLYVRRLTHSNKLPRYKMGIKTLWHVCGECHGFLVGVLSSNYACLSVECGCFGLTGIEIIKINFDASFDYIGFKPASAIVA